MRTSLDQIRVWLDGLSDLKAEMPAPGLEDLHRRLLEGIPGVAYRCRNDRNWTMEYISSWCRELTGHPPADFLAGKVTLGGLIEPADQAAVWDSVQRALAEGRPFELFYRLHTASGEVKWVWDRGQAVAGRDSEPTTIEGFILDVTSQMELRRMLFRTQRYETVARTIRRSVHDLNNVFTSMVGFLDLLLMTRRDDEALAAQLTKIRGLAERAMEINRRTREAVHRQSTGRTVVDLNQLVAQLADSMAQGWAGDQPVLTRTHTSPLRVVGDPAELEQVLFNLTLNALESAPRGAVEIRCLDPGHEIGVEVRDSGTGIPRERIELIRQPFFSTKGQAGMGLTVADAIVRDHGGRIEVESECGKGSVFRLVLPAAAESESEMGTLEELLR